MELRANDGPLSDEAIREAALLSAMAFNHTPPFVEIFRTQDDVERQERNCLLMEKEERMLLSKEPMSVRCFRSGDRAEMRCVAILLDSTVSFSWWDKLRAGLLTLLYVFGFSTVERLITSADYHDAMNMEIMGSRPHVRLLRMVVHPSYQGRGIGSRCLAELLEHTDRRGLPVSLSTQYPRNLIFYERLGFRLVKECDYEPSDGNEAFRYKTWFMVREPSSSATTPASRPPCAAPPSC